MSFLFLQYISTLMKYKDALNTYFLATQSFYCNFILFLWTKYISTILTLKHRARKFHHHYHHMLTCGSIWFVVVICVYLHCVKLMRMEVAMLRNVKKSLTDMSVSVSIKFFVACLHRYILIFLHNILFWV